MSLLSSLLSSLPSHFGYVLFLCLLASNVYMYVLWYDYQSQQQQQPSRALVRPPNRVIDDNNVIVPPVSMKVRRKFPMDTHRWDKNFHDIFNVPDPVSRLIGPDNVTFPDKYVIYRCDGHSMSYCGGWADRVRGMFTAYILANLTGRTFKVEILMPDCDVRQFMVPNHVQWSLATSFHDVVRPGPAVTMWDMWGNLTLYDRHFRYTDFVHHPVMKSDYFYLKANHDNMDGFKKSTFHGRNLQWMQGLNRVAMNRFLYKHLLKPSRYLQYKVSSFLARHVAPREKLICAHLRMGRNPTIPMETRESVSFQHLQRVWSFLTQQASREPESTKIFLMSDSREVIDEAMRQPFRQKLFVSPGNIVHIELSEYITDRQKCEGLEKVILEQLVLLHCDTLIVSDSGLSRMAAYVRGSNDNLYCFLSQGIIIPCDMINIKTLYKSRG